MKSIGIGRFLTEKKFHKQRAAVFSCLAVLAIGGTAVGLKLYGQALNHKKDVLNCKFEVHEHTDACWSDDEDGYICGYADYVIHVHDELCYSRDGDLLCEILERDVHEHDDDCYEIEKTLICGYDELDFDSNSDSGDINEHVEQVPVCYLEEHEHSDDCYEETEGCELSEHTHDDSCYADVLDCDESEHMHDDGCYDPETGDLTCDKDEHEHDDFCYTSELACNTEEHVHDDGCEGDRELVCDIAEHEHDSSCYEQADIAIYEEEGHTHDDTCYEETAVLTCGELEMHEHDDECFDEDGNWVCGTVELLRHQHTDLCIMEFDMTADEVLEALKNAHHHDEACYNDDGDLICGYEAAHAHTEYCYDEDGELICGYEALTHVHLDECYDENGELTCGYEAAAHLHNEKCYDADGNLACGYETLKHKHTDECYDENGELTCGYEAETHVHTDECYDENGELICGYESETHLHTKDCYDEDGHLICGYGSLYHVHNRGCYDANGNLICGYEAEKHVHVDECYDEHGNLTCGYGTLEHEHTDACYDEDGNLICGFDESGERIIPIYCLDYIHSHTDACYDADDNLTCGKADYAIHGHGANCTDEDGVLICPVPEREGEVHEHSPECYGEEDELICGELEVREHVHDINCTIPGDGEHNLVRVFEGDGFIVTAEFSLEANIPDEAGFLVEKIDADSEDADEQAHYENRLNEYREAVGDKTADAKALFKIGFYLDDSEIEPEAPVAITIQFLDENGLKDGKPVHVIHFMDDDYEVLDGGISSEQKTSFELNSFSEVLIGQETDGEVVPVDFEVEYNAGDLDIRLTVKGDAVFGNDSDPEDVDIEAENGPESVTGGNLQETEVVSSGPDDDVSMTFKMAELPEGSSSYIALSEFANEIDGEDREDDLLLKAWCYGLERGGILADLSGCEIHGYVLPSEQLVSEAGNNSDDGNPYTLSVMALFNDEDGSDDTEKRPETNSGEVAPQSEVDINLTGFYRMGARVSGTPNPKFTVSYYAWLDRVTTYDTGTELDHVKVIDTSSEANGGYAQLPYNGNLNLAHKWLEIQEGGALATTRTLTRIYHNRNLEYHKSPTINYMNSLVDNPYYNISEVWVRKSGTDSDESTSIPESELDMSQWEVYPVSEGIHFTNREVSAEKGKYIYISDGAELMFVYNPTTNESSKFDTMFYDYDITDGMVYVIPKSDQEDIKYDKWGNWWPTTTNLYKPITTGETHAAYGDVLVTEDEHTAMVKYYVDADEQGINYGKNYDDDVDTPRFGFGNSFGPYGDAMWDYNTLNKSNAAGFSGCTFRLVASLNFEGNDVVFQHDINAPSLFGGEDAVGKYPVDNWQLGFQRSGDTYTLANVYDDDGNNVLSNLNMLGYSVDGWHPNNKPVTKKVYSNEFWPMDHSETFGTGTHDVKWGYPDTHIHYNTKNYFPAADHKVNHNSFFGMNYAVSFNITDEYDGPLEYYFFGDDDMWVFLDDELVCDIGGVHSAVGEYVDLWDYLHRHGDECFDEAGNCICSESYGKDGEEHTLRFFYTERGMSGSTCWMQFTLPSVSSLTPEKSDKEYGELMVSKTVAGITDSGDIIENGDIPKDEEFEFTIRLTDSEGNNLPDDYSYVKYDKDGNEIAYDLIIWDGGTFTLKDGEKILIKYLPSGARYEIEETGHSGTVDFVTDIRNQDNYTADYNGLDASSENYAAFYSDLSEGDRNASGTIIQGETAEVEYRNKFYVYGLPETGGFGTNAYVFAGSAVLILFAAACFMHRRRRGEM